MNPEYEQLFREVFADIKDAALKDSEIDNLISHKIKNEFLGEYFDKIYDFWLDICWYPNPEVLLGRKIYNLLCKNIVYLEQNDALEPYEVLYILWLLDNEYLSYNNACKMFRKEPFDYQENSEEYIKSIIKEVKKENTVIDINYLIGQCLKKNPNLNPRKLRELII